MSKELGRILKEARDAKGLSQSAVGGKVGVSRAAVGQWEAGTNAPSTENLSAVARFLDLDAGQLLGLLSGAPAPVARREPIVKSYDPDNEPGLDEFDPDRMNTARTWPENAVGELKSIAGLGDGDVVQLIYKPDGSGGLMHTEALQDDYWTFPKQFIRDRLDVSPARLLMIACRGDSMEPTLRAGDYVSVDTGHRIPSPEGMYALLDDADGVAIKRLEMVDRETVRIISDNPKHSPKDRDLESARIIGRVVFTIRPT